MTEFSKLEILTRQFLRHLLDLQGQRFQERRYMQDEMRQNAEYHAEQTMAFRSLIKRDEWDQGGIFLRNFWPDGWQKPEEDTPEFEELSRLILRAYLQYHIIMHDRFVGAPEVAPIDTLFANLDQKVPERRAPKPKIPTPRLVGRPPLKWGALRTELSQMDMSQIKIGKRGWRGAVCRKLLEWYIDEFQLEEAPEVTTLRDELKAELDEILLRHRLTDTR